MYMYMYTYIYIYIYICLDKCNIDVHSSILDTAISLRSSRLFPGGQGTPNLPTNIVDFGGFDSSIVLI